MWALGKLGRCCSHQALIMQCWGIGVFGNLGFGIEGLGDWGISARFRPFPPVTTRFCPFLPVSACFRSFSPLVTCFRPFPPVFAHFRLFPSVSVSSVHFPPYPSLSLHVGDWGIRENGNWRIEDWGMGDWGSEGFSDGSGATRSPDLVFERLSLLNCLS